MESFKWSDLVAEFELGRGWFESFVTKIQEFFEQEWP